MTESASTCCYQHYVTPKVIPFIPDLGKKKTESDPFFRIAQNTPIEHDLVSRCINHLTSFYISSVLFYFFFLALTVALPPFLGTTCPSDWGNLRWFGFLKKSVSFFWRISTDRISFVFLQKPNPVPVENLKSFCFGESIRLGALKSNEYPFFLCFRRKPERRWW